MTTKRKIKREYKPKIVRYNTKSRTGLYYYKYNPKTQRAIITKVPPEIKIAEAKEGTKTFINWLRYGRPKGTRLEKYFQEKAPKLLKQEKRTEITTKQEHKPININQIFKETTTSKTYTNEASQVKINQKKIYYNMLKQTMKPKEFEKIRKYFQDRKLNQSEQEQKKRFLDKISPLIHYTIEIWGKEKGKGNERILATIEDTNKTIEEVVKNVDAIRLKQVGKKEEYFTYIGSNGEGLEKLKKELKAEGTATWNGMQGTATKIILSIDIEKGTNKNKGYKKWKKKNRK